MTEVVLLSFRKWILSAQKMLSNKHFMSRSFKPIDSINNTKMLHIKREEIIVDDLCAWITNNYYELSNILMVFYTIYYGENKTFHIRANAKCWKKRLPSKVVVALRPNEPWWISSIFSVFFVYIIYVYLRRLFVDKIIFSMEIVWKCERSRHKHRFNSFVYGPNG